MKSRDESEPYQLKWQKNSLYLRHINNMCKSADIEAEKHKFTSTEVEYASTCPTVSLSPSFSFTLSHTHTHPYPMYVHVHNLVGDDQLLMSMRW